MIRFLQLERLLGDDGPAWISVQHIVSFREWSGWTGETAIETTCPSMPGDDDSAEASPMWHTQHTPGAIAAAIAYAVTHDDVIVQVADFEPVASDRDDFDVRR